MKKEELEELFKSRELGLHTNEYGYVHKIPNYDNIIKFIISLLEDEDNFIK